MDTIHLLKVSPETRKTIKEQAIRLHNKGKKEAEIADALNIWFFTESCGIDRNAIDKRGMKDF